MIQAYIVFEGEAEKRRATAVFSSKWRAEEYADVVCGEIEEFAINGQLAPPHPRKMMAWRTYIDHNDTIIFGPKRVSCRDFKQVVVFFQTYEHARVLSWARDDWHAERIAKAWRMKLALMGKWHAAHGLDENIVLRFGEDF